MDFDILINAKPKIGNIVQQSQETIQCAGNTFVHTHIPIQKYLQYRLPVVGLGG